jgi:hypothetical protein
MVMNAICLIIPMTVAVQFNVAGGLFLTELLLPIFAISHFFFGKTNNSNHKYINVTIVACLIYLASLMLSDIWNQSSFDQYSRGWSRIISFLSNLISLYILANNHRIRILLMAVGFAIGRIWLSFDVFDGYVIPWKLGLAKPTTLMLIVLCATLPFLRSPRNLVSPLLIIALGLINIISDFRSLGGVLILTGTLLTVSALLGPQNLRARPRQFRSMLTIIVILGGAAALAKSFYSYSAHNEWLSERAHNKFEAQAQRSQLPLLIAGRNELLVSLEAIFDAPILGHGSWPENPYYADRLAILRYQYNLYDRIGPAENDLIPTHSHILGSWVEAGIAGAGFWALILSFAGRALSLSLRGHSQMRPLYIYSAILLIWDILFSPFAGFRRLESAFLIVVLLRSLLQRQISTRAIASLRRRRKRKPWRRQKRRTVVAISRKSPITG